MRFQTLFGVVSISLFTLSGLTAANAQSDTLAAPLAMCDPLMEAGDATSNGEEAATIDKTVRYDLETAEPITSDAAVIDLVFEEVWDPATGADAARPETCAGEPSYVINWAGVMGRDDNGDLRLRAEGYMSLRKDGTFRLTYEKRPYEGSWTMPGDGKIRMEAFWLNGGAPLEVQVEKVTTPVEFTGDGGDLVTFDEVVYRIGPFRLLPLSTTVKGIEQNCACKGG
ncbi:MAG: hypothetical protein R3D63_04250 [Paracoccaceae bacterium]